MKITRRQLRSIIQEELDLMNESHDLFQDAYEWTGKKREFMRDWETAQEALQRMLQMKGVPEVNEVVEAASRYSRGHGSWKKIKEALDMLDTTATGGLEIDPTHGKTGEEGFLDTLKDTLGF